MIAETTEIEGERFWNRQAEGYAARPLPNPRATAAKLKIIEGLFRPTDTVLDIGCGTGTIALEYAKHVAWVHAADLSRDMIAIGRRKAAAAGVDNVTFHHAGADGITGLVPAPIDVISAFNVLHFLDDRRAFLSNVFELLRPGGYFVGSNPCMGDSWVRFALPVMRLVYRAPPIFAFKARDLDADYRHAGFTEIERPDVGAGKTVAFWIARKPDR